MENKVSQGRKIIALVCVLLLVSICALIITSGIGETYASGSVWSGGTATSFSGGDGSQSSPYLISTGEELNLLSGIVSGAVDKIGDQPIDSRDYNNPEVYFSLSADIVLNDTTNLGAWDEHYAPRNSFSPIGVEGKPFSAQFDGAGHTVSGIYVNSGEYVGLFGYVSPSNVQSEITIQNLRITDSVFVGKSLDIGSVAGKIIGKVTIQNCFSDADVISYTVADIGTGGIVGSMHSVLDVDPKIVTCIFDGSVVGMIDSTVSSYRKFQGGIVGKVWENAENRENSPTIQGCINRGMIQVNSAVSGLEIALGGIAGRIDYNCTIIDSGNEGAVTSLCSSTNTNVGGIIGEAYSVIGTFSRLWNTGAISGQKNQNYTGGIIGKLFASNTRAVHIKDLYNAGEVVGHYAGGIIARFYAGSSYVLNIYNVVNEGYIEKTSDGALGVFGAVSKNLLALHNFINYNRDIYNDISGIKIFGMYDSESSNLNGSENIIFSTNFQVDASALPEERGAKINTINNEGELSSHISIDYNGISMIHYTALAALNALSSKYDISKWEDAGQKKGQDNLKYGYWLPVPFVELFGAKMNAWDETDTTAYDGFGGTGTKGDPFIISSAQGLYTLQLLINTHKYLGNEQSTEQMKKYNTSDVYYRLGADIYLNDVNDYENWSKTNWAKNTWQSIGKSSDYAFSANFDGGGHTIFGMQVVSQFKSDLNGLFGRINNGAVTNLKIKNAMILTSSFNTGGIVAEIKAGRIENCSFSGKIFELSEDNVACRIGGICGKSLGNDNVVIENCESYAYIQGDRGKLFTSEIGGIIGTADGSTTILNCGFYGDNDSNYSYAGGIVGVLLWESKAINCVNYGSVTGNFHIGGIAGSMRYQALISSCQSAVASKLTIIDLAYSSSSAVSVGGIVGGMDGGKIIACKSSATITLKEGFILKPGNSPRIRIGGIVGTIMRASSTLSIVNTRTTKDAKTIYGRPNADDVSRRMIVLGGIVGYEESVSSPVLLNCINEMAVEYANGNGFTGSKFDPYLSGLIGYVKNLAQIQNCVNLKSGYEYGLAYIENVDEVSAHYNYSPYNTQLFNTTGDNFSNNRFFDLDTGNLLTNDNSLDFYRFEASGILVSNLGEALNAYVTENNSNDLGELKPLADRLTYFEMMGGGASGQKLSLSMTEIPVFYVRYIANRPDNKSLNGGFFIKEGSKAEDRTSINAEQVTYAGFTFNGWFFGQNKFDFYSTLFDRNYTLNAAYVMDKPEILPTPDISVVYNGEKHEIKLNANILHDLGDRKWIHTYETASGKYQFEHTADEVFFDVVSAKNTHKLTLEILYIDSWGTTYSTSVEHTFSVEIRQAPLTVVNLTAEDRLYDAKLDVVLQGGELSGIKTRNGVLDKVQAVSMPVKGRLADKNAGTNKAVIFDDIVVEGEDLYNYYFIQPTVTVNIEKSKVSLNGASAINKIYDGNTLVRISASGFVGILGADDISFDSTKTIAYTANKNVGNGKLVSVESVGLSGKDAGNYTCTSPTELRVDITKKMLDIIDLHTAYSNRQYNQTTEVALTGGTLSGIIPGDIVSCIMPTVGNAESQYAGKWGVIVTAPELTGTDAKNYDVQISYSLSINIDRKDVEITNLSAKDREYNRTGNVELTKGELSGIFEGDTVVFNMPTSGTIGEFSAGKKKVDISWGELGGEHAYNYRIVLPEQLTVTIYPKTLSIEGIFAEERVYDGTNRVLLSDKNAKLNGVETGDTVSFQLPEFGILDSASVGNGKKVEIKDIVLKSDTQPSILDSYTIQTHVITTNILRRQITASWDNNISFTYNGKAQSPSAVALTGVNGEFAVLEISGAQVNANNNYTATATLASVTNGEASNYILTNDTLMFSIVPRNVTVEVNQSVTYQENQVWTNSEWNGNVKGLVHTHTFSGTIKTVDSIVKLYESKNGGFEYVNIAIIDGDSNNVTNNYDISYNLTVNITASAITYTVENYEGYFDNNEHTIALNVSTLGADVEYSKNGTDFSNELPTFTDAGEYTVHFRVKATNYTTVTSSASVSILPAELKVTITANGGIYNGSSIEANYIVEGAHGPVDVTLTYTGMSNGGVSYDDTIAPSNAGEYTVTATIDENNYILERTFVKFSISRAEALINIDGVQTNYTYNGNKQVVNSGAILNHDETTLEYKNNEFTEVGNGSYTVTILAEESYNYSAVETTVQISVKQATLRDETKDYTGTYDGDSHGITVNASGFLGNDDMSRVIIEYSIDGNTWTSTPILVKYVDDSKTIHYRMTSEDYEPLSGTAEISISRKPLEIKDVTGGEQTYNNATKVLRISGGRLEGAISGDLVSPVVPIEGTMADKHVGQNKLVTMADITLTGEHAGNYTLIQPDVFVTVTQRSLSVQGFSVQNKTYDGNTTITVSATGATLITPLPGDDVSVVEIIASANDANVGQKDINITSITLAGADKDNYTVTMPTGWTANIASKPLSFTLTADGGAYNGNPIGASINVSGYLPGESGTIILNYNGTTNGGIAYNDTNAPVLAGSYTVTASLVDNQNYVLGENVSKQFVITRANSVIDIGNMTTEYTYTGEPQIINSGATLNHEDASLLYSDNVFTDVGTGIYTVVISVVQTDNYESASIEVEIKVKKNSYDMSNVKFADGSFIADGKVYSLFVTGLPNGVTVQYVNNGHSEAGIYIVTAVFNGDYDNYEKIDNMTATLNLKRANLTGNGMELSSEDGFDADIELDLQSVNLSDYSGLKLDDKLIDVLAARNVSLIKNGLPIGVNGTITIKMVIDESMRHRDDLMVVFIADNGEIINMNATREGDYMVFNTDHNSVYAIVSYTAMPQGLTTGAIVGIVIGIILVLIVLILIIVLLRRRRKYPKNDNDNNTYSSQTLVIINTNENSADESMETDKQTEFSDEMGAEDKLDASGDVDVNCVENQIEDDRLENELSASMCESDETESTENQDADSDESNGDEAKEAEEELAISSDETAISNDNQTDNDENRVIEEDAEVNALESPVEENPLNNEVSIADAEKIEPSQETAVVFVSAGQSLEEAFQSLSREQKDFYERLRSYALEKTGAVSNKTQSYEAVKVGRKNIVKFSIKRNTTVAAFSLEHPLLKLYKKQSVEDEGGAIKSKPTEVFVSNVAAFKAAKDMIDIVVRQIELEKEEARKLRNSKKKAKSTEESKG